jgi:two-component system cell cycle sensor histidine kinase/response regulator CckA
VKRSGEQAVAEAQRVIANDVLRWALPALASVSALALILGAVTGTFAQHPARAMSTSLMFGITVLSGVLLWKKKHRAAATMLIAGVVAVVLFALTRNGGLRSPSTSLMLFLVVLCGWLFGPRAATITAVIALAVATTYFVLGMTGQLPEAPPLALHGYFTMLMMSIALIWTTASRPPARMREALIAATERQAAFEAEQVKRLEAAQQFRAVFDQSPHLLALVHPDGRLFAVNRTTLEFAGLPTAEPLIGTEFMKGSAWSEADRAHLKAGEAEIAAGRTVRFDTQRVDHRGRLHHLEFSLSPFRNEAGELAYLIAEARDVTDAVLAKQRRERIARLELVGQLAGGVAHDFNNVLMAIIGSNEALRFELEEQGHLSPTVLESLDTIVQAGKRAGDLTARLLTLGRRTIVATQPLSINQVVQSAVKLLERTLPSSIRTTFTPGSMTELVDGDAAALESTIINLAVNARDAMPNGGELVFTTELVMLDPEWCKASGFDLTSGPHVRVSVRDTGTGISPEHLARIFEPFFTTKEDGKGTGLGLASVFGVMREHRGSVHVYSELSRGTVFHLSLPVSQTVPTHVEPVTTHQRWDGLRALVVDDEAPIRTVLPRLLTRMGISSIAVESAEAAVPHLGDHFDLLVTDVILPGRRGSELALEFLAKHPESRALLISGFTKDAELSTLPPERTRVLTKPFTFQTLEKTLRALLPKSDVDGASGRG